MAGPATKEAPVEEPKYETLSKQAADFLKNNGYSQTFIAGLMMMLREAGSVHARTEIPQPKQTDQEFMDSPMRSGKKEYYEMPKSLSWEYSEHKIGGRTLKIPDIGPYFPNTTQYPETYKAFASPEGQKFMNNYYTKGWLRKDDTTGEWVLKNPLKMTPRKVTR